MNKQIMPQADAPTFTEVRKLPFERKEELKALLLRVANYSVASAKYYDKFRPVTLASSLLLGLLSAYVASSVLGASVLPCSLLSMVVFALAEILQTSFGYHVEVHYDHDLSSEGAPYLNVVTYQGLRVSRVYGINTYGEKFWNEIDTYAAEWRI